MADEEGFVRRWSRRKSEARAPARPAEPVPPAAPMAAEARTPPPAPTEAPREGAPDAVEPPALPDIESLTYESDFTVFLRPGVPAELRNRALQRLWRSDPVLANLDGLVEYGEDYSRVGMVKEIVRTAYRVGRGLLDRIETAAEQPPDEATGEPAAGNEARAGEADDESAPAPQPPPERSP